MKNYILIICLLLSGLLLSQTGNEDKEEESIPFTWFTNGEHSVLSKEFIPPVFIPKQDEESLPLFTENDAPAFRPAMPIFIPQSEDSLMMTELAADLPKQYLKIFTPKEWE